MPEIRFEADAETVNVIDWCCAATGKRRTEFINRLLKKWARQKLHEARSVVLRVAGGNPGRQEVRPEPAKKDKIRTAAESRVALHKKEWADVADLTRRSEDIALELHALGNELHKAGMHRQGTAANVAVGVIEDITEELKDGG